MTPRKNRSMDDLMLDMDDITRALCEEADVVLFICDDEDEDDQLEEDVP